MTYEDSTQTIENDSAQATSSGTAIPADTALTDNQNQSIDLQSLLTRLVGKEGSDLHLKVGQPPVLRVNGKLVRMSLPPLDADHIKRLLGKMISDEQKKQLLEAKELDVAFSIKGLSRFRVNIFFQKQNLGAVIRLVPFEIRSIDELELPPITKKLATLQRGLVLVTGPTGSGKSTTLAAIIDHINRTRKAHIITVEDPIEFLHQDKESAIHQRELGSDTHSFTAALRNVMRQSPDVILVGELRDLETMSLAMTAAETGHLVFATLHTSDSAQTIDRVVNLFPAEQQSQARMQLANSLRGVICQTLVPAREGGRVAAFEVLICHSGVTNLIREGKTHQIYNLIQAGARYGMQLLDKNLQQLVQDKLISFDDAVAKASNPAELNKPSI